MNNMCPVCGCLNLSVSPYDNYGVPSFGICPCCFVEFGNDDVMSTYEELRQKWIVAGMPWISKSRQPPQGWNPQKQLLNLNLS